MRILLNADHDLSQPGLYHVEAKHTLSYTAGEGPDLHPAGPELNVEQSFDIELVSPKDSAAAEAAVRPYLAQLKSEDFEIRRESARVIATLPSVSIEPALTSILDDGALREFGIQGLERLNTETARQSLASLARSSKDEWLRDRASHSIGNMGDKTYLPLLVEMLGKEPNPGMDLLQAVGKLGGEDSIAPLMPYLSSSDSGTRNRTIWALAETNSRKALPLLVARLSDPDEQNRVAAANALTGMTHRSPSGETWPAGDPKSDVALWQRWLMSAGAAATVYSPDQCGPVDKLSY